MDSFISCSENFIWRFVSSFTSASTENLVQQGLCPKKFGVLQGGSSLIRRSDRKELLAQLVIYRVLTLVIILDRVPTQMQLPQQAPFLFRLGAPLKSSVEVLTACLHGSLSGIGNLPRQLAKMHYIVSFKQRDIDEWPMLVSSLGPDLSNGIILCKLISLLLGEVWSPCQL